MSVIDCSFSSFIRTGGSLYPNSVSMFTSSTDDYIYYPILNRILLILVFFFMKRRKHKREKSRVGLCIICYIVRRIDSLKIRRKAV